MVQTKPFRALLAAAALLVPCLSAQSGLQLSVIEGQEAQNPIDKGIGAPIVVELRDGAGAPVPRAEVTFRSPSDGPSATFFGASHVSKAWTDEQGRAQAASVTPNTIPGEYTILVEAGPPGSTVTAEVRQSNVAPAPPEKKKRRIGPKIWVPIVAGAILVIVGLAQGD